MEKVFIPTTKSYTELGKVVDMVEKMGLNKENTYVGGSFDAFEKTLNTGDVALVSSLTVFGSIGEILEKTTRLGERGIVLRSIAEPWFGQGKLTTVEFASKLFKLAATLHAPKKSVSNGAKRLTPRATSTIDYVDRLRTEHNLSVTKACKIAGCSLRTYYNHRKKVKI